MTAATTPLYGPLRFLRLPEGLEGEACIEYREFTRTGDPILMGFTELGISRPLTALRRFNTMEILDKLREVERVRSGNRDERYGFRELKRKGPKGRRMAAALVPSEEEDRRCPGCGAMEELGFNENGFCSNRCEEEYA